METTSPNPKGSNTGTNIPFDDKGHQKLTEVQSHIKELLNSGGNKNDLTEIFFALSYFYENYLIKEELFLKKTEYPNLESHSSSHKKFIKEIERLKDSINKDAMHVLKELDVFISGWLSDHESTYNADMVRYLKGDGFVTG